MTGSGRNLSPGKHGWLFPFVTEFRSCFWMKPDPWTIPNGTDSAPASRRFPGRHLKSRRATARQSGKQGITSLRRRRFSRNIPASIPKKTAPRHSGKGSSFRTDGQRQVGRKAIAIQREGLGRRGMTPCARTIGLHALNPSDPAELTALIERHREDAAQRYEAAIWVLCFNEFGFEGF